MQYTNKEGDALWTSSLPSLSRFAAHPFCRSQLKAYSLPLVIVETPRPPKNYSNPFRNLWPNRDLFACTLSSPHFLHRHHLQFPPFHLRVGGPTLFFHGKFWRDGSIFHVPVRHRRPGGDAIEQLSWSIGLWNEPIAPRMQ